MWDRLPACRFDHDRLEAYPTYCSDGPKRPIRSIKTHMNLHHLRCKSPEMVRKEFWVTMLAYKAIRTTALDGSWTTGVKPRELSFVSCCQFVLAAWDVIGQHSGVEHRRYCVTRLEQIGKFIVGKRPGRFEPRVRKKRGSNYNLMMQPRAELKSRLAVGDNSFETKSLRRMTVPFVPYTF